MIKIKTLEKISIEQIHEAFAKAFSDYEEPFDLAVHELKNMIERRGYLPEISFGAFAKGELVGFTLNGLGEWNDKKTAYDTGTGIIKKYRQQGLASQIFKESIPILKNLGIQQYLLEVIKTNTKAADLYLKSGFKISREYDYYAAEKETINLPAPPEDNAVQIKKLEIEDWEPLKRFWDFQPSWQNSVASINRQPHQFVYLGVFVENDLVGYGIVEPTTGDIPQFAIDKKHRRKRLASLLFKNLIEAIPGPRLKIINTWVGDMGVKLFLKTLNLKPRAGQYEMILEL